MSRLALANLALLCAIAILAAFVYFKPARENPAGQTIATLPPHGAARIRIEREGQPAIIVEKQGQTWRLVAPMSAEADPFQVERLLAIPGARSLQRFAATGLDRFELDRPRARIAVDGESFAFGMVNSVSGEQYVLTRDAVHAIEPRYGSALPVDPMQLARKQLLSGSEAPLRFEAGEFTVEHRDGKWQMTPVRETVSQDDFNRWIESWRLATALRVAPLAPRPPLAEIRVALKSGVTLRFTILQREPDVALGRDDEKLQYHFPAASAQRLLAAPGAAPAAVKEPQQ